MPHHILSADQLLNLTLERVRRNRRALPRLFTEGALPLGSATWAQTQVLLPAQMKGITLHNAFTGREVLLDGTTLDAAIMFHAFPAALLLSQ